MARVNGTTLPSGKLVSSREKESIERAQMSLSESVPLEPVEVRYRATDRHVSPVGQSDEMSSADEAVELVKTISHEDKGTASRVEDTVCLLVLIASWQIALFDLRVHVVVLQLSFHRKNWESPQFYSGAFGMCRQL